MQDALVSSVMQVGLVLAIGFLIYLFFGRKTGSFRRYLGLLPTSWTAVLLAAGLAVMFALAALLTPGLRELSGGEGSVVNEISGSAFNGAIVAALAIKALFQTSLSEEILFRGLIAKRLISRFGFAAGNTIQAVLFAGVHLFLLFIPGARPGLILAFIAFIALFAWVWGWLNEKVGGGSIIPGWIGHGLGNLISYLGFAWLAAH